MADGDEIGTRRVQRFGWIPDIPDARDFLFSAPEQVLSSELTPNNAGGQWSCFAV